MMVTKKTNKKFLTICLISLTTLFVILFLLGRLLTNRVDAYVMGLTDKISEKIGHPVTIDKVTTKWDWIYLKVSIKNLIVKKDNHAEPLFMAHEIISTVDALDSLRAFSLKFKHLLIRSPRMAIPLGQQDVAESIDPDVVFKILAMQRRVTIENGCFHIQDKDNVNMPFTEVRLDFKHIGNNKYNLIARGNVNADVQPEFIVAVNYYGNLNDFKSAMIEFEIKANNINLTEISNIVPKYRQDIVNGDFTELNFKGSIHNGIVREIQSDFAINQVTVDKKTVIKGGAGNIKYYSGNNNYRLAINDITVGNNEFFTQPIKIDSVTTDFSYNNNDDSSIISTENACIKFGGMAVLPQLNMQVVGNHIKELKLYSTLSDPDINKLFILLPDKKLSSSLCEWLKKSLVNGYIETITAEFLNNKLSWFLTFKDTELKYSQEWPSIDKIDAVLSMVDGNLSINATKAYVLGNPLRSLGVTYSEYKNAKYGIVNVFGNIDSTLESGLSFIKKSPLQKTIGAELETFKPSGAMSLDLALKINLIDTGTPVKIAAKIELKNDTLYAPELDLSLSNINGNLVITNDLLRSENLRLHLLGKPATALVVMEDFKNPNLKMSIKSIVEVVDIHKIFPVFELDHVSGKANIMASIDIPLHDNRTNKLFTLNSDLVGVKINLPAPFNKSADSKMPLQILYNMTDISENIVKIKYAGLIDAILFLKDKQLHGGHIAINKKLDNINDTENLHIIGNIKLVDWSTWKPLLQTKDSKEWLPIVADLNINTLKLNGTEYNSLKVKYYTERNELFVDCPVVTGTFMLSPEQDKIDVKLTNLNIPENNKGNADLLNYIQEKRVVNQLPLIQFSCDNMLIKKHTFKKINIELLPRTYGYEITNFSVNNDNIMLQSQGRWQMESKNFTVLSGNAYTKNFGKVLAEWGYVDSMTRGKGEINFAIQWDGSPADFDLLKLEGTSHIDLRSGSLTNVSPGLGRVIGLLSLESIQRRLQLDFSDLLSRGFAFDKFVADVHLHPGAVKSENILINSPAAKIEINGKTAIKSKELDFTMFVTPKVGAGLPIAAAIAAGNPAVGAAIWLFDKASGSKISEIAKYKYSVTGTWDKPKIDEISSSHVSNSVG